MCLGIAGQVIELSRESKDLARVNVFGAERLINIGLLERDALAPGEWVLIHVGFAIAKMTEAEATASMEFLEAMGGALTGEMPSAPAEKAGNDTFPEAAIAERKRES